MFMAVTGIFIKNGSPIQDLENITTRGENFLAAYSLSLRKRPKNFLPLVGYFHKSFIVEPYLYKYACNIVA